MFDSIVVVSALTHCASLYCVCDLKVAQMNVQRNLSREIMFHEFKLRDNTAKVVKNISYGKFERRSYLQYSKQMAEETSFGLQESWWSGKTVDSEAMLWVIMANLAISTRRVSGGLRHLHELSKSIPYCRILPHIINILQNIWLTIVYYSYLRLIYYHFHSN